MTELWRVKTLILWDQGGPGVNNFYFQKTGAYDVADAATRMRNFWNDIKAYVSTYYTFNVQSDVEVIDLATGEITGLDDAGTLDPVTGTDDGNLLPVVTQGLVRFRTGQYAGGREIRGRIFIPGATENNNDGGQPDGGYTSTILAAADDLKTSDLTAGPVIYSPTHHNAAPIVSASVWTKWAELRSRRD